MPIYHGSTGVAKVFIGSSEVARVYQGTSLIWENTPAEPPPAPTFTTSVTATSPQNFYVVQSNATWQALAGDAVSLTGSGFTVEASIVPGDPAAVSVSWTSGSYPTFPLSAGSGDTTVMYVMDNTAHDTYARDTTSTGGWIARVTGSTRIGGSNITLSAFTGPALIFQRRAGSTGTTLRNGVVVSSGTVGAAGYVSPGYYGKNGTNSGQFAAGRASHLAFWNRALTDTELATIYSAYAGTP